MVVQRYGKEIAGGAEQLCRYYATRLVERGHAVDVLTTRAASYVDWADSYPGGTGEIDGVRVHRLGVRHPRDHMVFGGLQQRVVGGSKPVPWYLQKEWMRQQGPDVPDLVPWLEKSASDFDTAVFFTYLYQTTWAGLPVAARRLPTILHPTAHDEPPLHLPLFDPVFSHPHAFGYLTVEELDLVSRRFRARQPHALLGVGVEQDRTGDPAEFRSRTGLGDRPYLLYVGRVDPHKGSDELYEQFVAYKQRHPGELALVFLGEGVKPLPPHPDVFVTGFVPDQQRWDALAGCAVYINPSYFESFSMSLCEAWSMSRPAMVQGQCVVTTGQVRRSGGGIPYRGFAEFEAALELVLAQPDLARRMGRSGRRFVETHYRWDEVMSRYERLLERTRSSTVRPGVVPAG